MIITDFWIKEIIEQICVGAVLKESKLDSGNRLALITVDNAVEFGLKFYASYNSLLTRGELNSNDALFKILSLIEGKEITADLSKKIKQFHNTRNDLYHGAKITTVKEKVVEEYVKNAKELFEGIFKFRMNEAEWRRLIQDIRKKITRVDILLKEPVSFEAVEIEGKHLIRYTTTAKIKNTESIILVIYGYSITRARNPDCIELEQSLKLSGSGISSNVLAARLSELRASGVIERKTLELKGKALNKLRKKFTI